jgi:hypothetical protein
VLSQEPHLSTDALKRRSPAKVWAGRLFGVAFGVTLAWLLAELLLRLLFFSLPPRLQLVLTHVHKTPFSDSRMLPDPIWQPDTDYLTITRPVQHHEQFGSADVRFTVTTETLWGSRVAFRTRQALVDQHVDGVAVGDSFTFCFVDEDNCWVRRLGALANRNIINMGITSTGSTSHQRVLSDFGMPLKPPLVIWQWFGNDANEDYGLALLRGETEVRSTNPSPPIPKLSWLEENSAFYVLLQLLLGGDKGFEASLQFHDPEYAEKGDVKLAFGQAYLWDAFDMSQPSNRDGWQRGQQAILEARDMVESYGGALVILLMPTKEQVYRDMSEPLLGAEKLALLDQPYQMMLTFCDDEGLTCIDLLTVFTEYAQAGEQLYYTTDMHLNARGNEVLAETLVAWLDERPAIFELAQ